MKILFFTNNLLGKDGWSRYSLDIIGTLQRIGVEAVCLVNKKDDSIDLKQYEILRKPLKYFNNPINIILDFLKIKRVINNENPDIVHFLVEPYALLLPLIYNKRIKYFLNICGSYALLPLKRIRTRILARFYYKKVEKIVSISNYTKNRLLEILPYLKEKISVVNCGIDLADIGLHSFNNMEKNIVFIGAVKERKGLLEAINALNSYNLKYKKDFIFNIIGEIDSKNIYFQKLSENIKDYYLENKIKFWGSIDEDTKNKLLKNADLFLMLSKVCGDYFEGFGLVYLEANKYGVPVIGPNDGGPKEAIKDGFSGFIVDIFKSGEVADKIYSVLYRGEIKRGNCLEWAKQNDVSLEAEKVKKLYEESIKNE